MMKLLPFCLVIQLMVTKIQSAHITICTDNQFFGEDYANSGKAYFDDVTGVTDRGYILGLTLYEINCCGFLDAYEVKVNAVGSLVFQLWRATSGTSYELVYQQTDTTTVGTNTITLDSSVGVTDGDRWGWWTSGAPLVMYERTTSCSGDCSVDYKTLTSLSVNDIQDWSGATKQGDKYAIRLRVDSNSAPSFTNLANTTTIADTTAVGTTVFTVTATDPDPGDVASLTSAMDVDTYFDFEVATGAVTVKASIISAPTPAALTFTVTDHCHSEGTGTLTVTITNVPPVINLLPNSTSISEIVEVSTTLHTFSYSDPGDTVTCSIVSPAGVPFTLTQTGTDLVLTSDANPGFNYTDTPSYVLNITCDDSKDPVFSTFTVNILENFGPTINNLGNFTDFSEDVATETLLYTLDVVDPEGDDFNCSLNTASSTPASAASLFNVRLKTASSVWAIYTDSSAVFNYSDVHTFRLKTDCQDARKTNQGTFNVYITANTAPYFTNLPNSVTLATTAAVGHTIFTLSYNDLEGDTGTYNIACDPAGCPFTLLQSGVIQLNALVQGTTIPGYDVTATVRDARRQSKARVLTVLMSGINAAPSISNLATTFAIAENSAFSTRVVTTICQDSNAGDTLVYSMTCSSSGLTYFTISSTAGTITTSSTVNINYETIAAAGSAVFTCSVTCSDGQVSDTKSVDLEIVNVNEAPYFGQSAYSITANEGTAGTVISSTGFTVSDDDTGDSATFKLDCGTSSQFFSIDKTSGVVSYSSDYDVDDGARPTAIACTVKATDVYGLTATASVQINIDNINDNSPVFASESYTFFSDVSASLNTVLGTVTASDVDSGTYGTITYTLNSLPHDEDFFGVSQSGEIYIKTSLAGLGDGAVVTFSVLATDGGGLTDTCSVTIVTHTTSVSSVYVDTTRYRTFFEDPKNIPWFMACILTLLAIIGFSGWLILTKQTIPCPYSMKCCKIGKEYDTADRGNRVRRFSHQDIRNDVYAFE